MYCCFDSVRFEQSFVFLLSFSICCFLQNGYNHRSIYLTSWKIRSCHSFLILTTIKLLSYCLTWILCSILWKLNNTFKFRKKIWLPHCGAVKMHHHPLWRIKGNWWNIFYSFKPVSEFWTYKCSASIRCINMEPKTFFFTLKKKK